MKFMKLGTRPDIFYSDEATRKVVSDTPSDLIIQINNTKYVLHKYPLLPRCGLLRRLCSDSTNSDMVKMELHDIPGGEDAFEICAKFCYGVAVNLSAENIVSALCAAKFLRMTEAVDKGNLVLKLETFFNSCILEGWKDSILALQTTGKLPEWSESLGIIRRCIESIVEKILASPSKVTWSYTYTRPGYIRKLHKSVPKDWWTEDISNLDIDLFRCIITAVKSTSTLHPQLIGEALHVYACRWLEDTETSHLPENSSSQSHDRLKKLQILETVSSMIPLQRGSVSIRFLLRLLSIANEVGAFRATKAELIRRSGLQLEEATLNDLLFSPKLSCASLIRNVDLVRSVLESFLLYWRRNPSGEAVGSIQKVGKLIDSYLVVVSRGAKMPVSQIISLVVALPEVARPDHDDLYKVIDIYLKEHPDVSKTDKKELCAVLDCNKLSLEVCAQAMRNEQLPLRTVVQILFFAHERGGSTTTPIARFTKRSDHQETPRSDGKLLLDPQKRVARKEVSGGDGGTPGGKSDPQALIQRRPRSNQMHRDGKFR